MIAHHLDDATLVRYAAGDLGEAFLVLVASHLAMCEACRERRRIVEDIGGGLLEGDAGTALEPGAFDRLMGRIEAVGGDDRIAIPATANGNVPSPLQAYIGDRVENVAWRPVAPGVQKHAIRLNGEENSSLFMLRIAEGMSMPEHGHGGAEMTLVLQGAYRDDFGRFGPGDIADLDEHVEHQPTVEAGGACICLVATEAPTRFKGLLARLFQPFVRI